MIKLIYWWKSFLLWAWDYIKNKKSVMHFLSLLVVVFMGLLCLYIPYRQELKEFISLLGDW